PQVSLGDEFGGLLGRFLTETEVGQAWILQTVLGGVITVLAFAVRGWITVGITAILAGVALVPMATQSHSGGLDNHHLAVVAIIVHIVASALWLGGLVTLVLVRPALTPERMRAVLERYSAIALAAFVVVALSGLLRSVPSFSSVGEVFTDPYGLV